MPPSPVQLQRPCNMGLSSLSKFQEKFHEQYRGRKCNMWMSEQPIISLRPVLPVPASLHVPVSLQGRTTTNNNTQLDDDASHVSLNLPYNHTYVIIREPSEHVLSQYFHCTESEDHKNHRHLMPSLDKLLDFHVSRIANATNEDKDDAFPVRSRNKHMMPKKLFKCYDPIDQQSYFTQFYKNVTVDDLKNTFDIMGDFHKVGKSICAIAIRYSGYVPSMCLCTSNSMNNTNNKNKPRKRHDHGVQHHGSTYVHNLTNAQKEKIDKITRLDRILYQRSQIVFRDQVKEIEDELNITLCDDPDLNTNVLDSVKLFLTK